jgi:lysophospholipase L1-like esterase
MDQKVDKQTRTVVCFGDSLTRGVYSFNYVDVLQERLAARGFRFINRGVDGELAYNLLQRVDEVVKMQPSFVTILVGTNDVNATMSARNMRRYIKDHHLPVEPNLEWYEENLRKIVARLQHETHARLALISPPVLSEDLRNTANARVVEYSAAVRRAAESFGAAYLPLNETQREFLGRAKMEHPHEYHDGLREPIWAALRHFVLRQTFDRIAKANHYLLLTDGIHLNSTGGAMVADLIEEFLLKETLDERAS